jgi:hypothetical protein
LIAEEAEGRYNPSEVKNLIEPISKSAFKGERRDF